MSQPPTAYHDKGRRSIGQTFAERELKIPTPGRTTQASGEDGCGLAVQDGEIFHCSTRFSWHQQYTTPAGGSQ